MIMWERPVEEFESTNQFLGELLLFSTILGFLLLGVEKLDRRK
jgi:hypothetical protein